MKAIVDGGVLSERVLLSTAALAVLWGADSLATLRARLESWGYALIVLVAAIEYGVLAWLAPQNAFPSAAPIIFTTALYLLLLAWHIAGHRIAKCVLGVYALSQASVEVATNYWPMIAPLTPDTTVIELDCARPESLARPRANPATPSAAFAVYRARGEDPRKPRHTLLRVSDDLGVRAMPITIKLLDARAATGALSAMTGAVGLSIVSIQPANRLRARIDLHYPGLPPFALHADSVLQRNNHWVYLHCAAGMLRAAGLSEFLIIAD